MVFNILNFEKILKVNVLESRYPFVFVENKLPFLEIEKQMTNFINKLLEIKLS